MENEPKSDRKIFKITLNFYIRLNISRFHGNTTEENISCHNEKNIICNEANKEKQPTHIKDNIYTKQNTENRYNNYKKLCSI